MNRIFPVALAAVVVMSAASSVRANMLINGSLESAIPPKQPDNLVYVTTSTHANALTGWTIDSGRIDIVPNSYFESSDGNFSVDMVGTPGLGSISQQVATIASDSYTLTFDFSINPQNGPSREKNDLKDLRVEAIGADGVTILASQDYTGTAGTRTKTDMQYSSQSFSFTADGAFSTIRLLAVRPANRAPGAKLYTGPVVDNLDLELGAGNPTPEPASLAVLGMGATALLSRRRRRR
jgi:choice-of-anchor C domain-containing protein